MPNRIFPTVRKASLGSEREFNGINVEGLEDLISQAHLASDGKKLSAEAMNLLQQKLAEATDDVVEASDKEAKREIPEAFKPYIKKKKGDDGNDEESDDTDGVREGDCSKCGKDGCGGDCNSKEASRTRKIRFTEASQISGDALEAAKAQGDEPRVKAILAEREARRTRLAARVVEASKEQIERSQKLAKRHAYRMTIVAQAEEAARVAETSGQKTVTAAAENDEDGLKLVSAMNTAEKNTFRKMAEKNGFSAEYIDAVLGKPVTVASTEEESIREVMSSALTESTKKTAIAGLIRTAKLDNENISRLKRYWKEELGYGDAAWVDDLFTSKYD